MAVEGNHSERDEPEPSLKQLISKFCDSSLEFLYYLPCADSDGKREACVCRLRQRGSRASPSPSPGTQTRSGAPRSESGENADGEEEAEAVESSESVPPSLQSVILRLHRGGVCDELAFPETKGPSSSSLLPPAPENTDGDARRSLDDPERITVTGKKNASGLFSYIGQYVKEGGGEGERGKSSSGKDEVKLWDFLEELHLEPAQLNLLLEDDAEADRQHSYREIEYLPFDDKSVLEVLREQGRRSALRNDRQSQASAQGNEGASSNSNAHYPSSSSSPSYFLHPNILTPLAFFRAKNDCILSIYPNAGNSLSSVLKFSTKGFLNRATVSLLVYQIAQFIKFCHNSGIQFGGLSTSKLLLNDQAWVYALVDYRKVLASANRRLRRTGDEETEKAKGLTLTPSSPAPPVQEEPGGENGVGQEHKNEESSNRHGENLGCSEAARSLSEAFIAWRHGAVSNFDYLLMLNLACGRERGNLAFYPVLPWVMDMSINPLEKGEQQQNKSAGDGLGESSGKKEGKGKEEGDSEHSWRDLGKTKWRLAKGDLQLDMTYISSDPPHHVSDEALSELTVCVYLARRLQKSVLTDVVRASFEPREYPSSMARMYSWTPDEAIPDFYDNPEIFSSIHDEMADLQVPEWSSSPADFICKHRAALESPRVSSMLHHWIDLNFGYALYGEVAIREKNVHLPYKDTCFPRCRGRFQIFTQSHPARFPKPRRELAFDIVLEQERVEHFVRNQFGFCKRVDRKSYEDDRQLLDIFFLYQVACVLCSSDVRDVLHADVGYCPKRSVLSDSSKGLFPRLLQKHMYRLMSTSPVLTMDSVVLCPCFESHIKDAFALLACVNNPLKDLSSKLELIAKTLRMHSVESVDKSLYVVIFRSLLDVLHNSSDQSASESCGREKPSELVGNCVVEILEMLVQHLPKDVRDNFLVPFLVNAIQGGTRTKILSSGRKLLFNISDLILRPRFMVKLLEALGANDFFKAIFPRILEFVTQKTASSKLVSDVLVHLVAHIPLPVILKQVLDPMLNLLYYDVSYMQLILDLSKKIGRGFVSFQLYPRLLEIVKKAVFSTGKGHSTRRKMLRPSAQVSDHLSCTLTLLKHIVGVMEPGVILQTLIEDTSHKDIQQPSILFQILLLPYPDLKVLLQTSSLLVEGAKVGGGAQYLEVSLLPNLEPIFYVNEDSDDSRSTSITALSFLYEKLCSEIGRDIVDKATRSWHAIEEVRFKSSKAATLPLDVLHFFDSSGEEAKQVKTRKNNSSYRWLKKGFDKTSLSFTPIMPEGIRVAPESYASTLGDTFNTSFKCIHQFKSSVSKLKYMTIEEMGQLAFAGGAASTSSSSPVIRAWDFEEERVVRIYVNHSASITGLASLSNGKVAASCDSSGKLHIWEPHSDQYVVYKVVPNFEYIKYQQYLTASPVKRKENVSLQASPTVSVSEGGCTCLTSFDEMVILGTSEGLVPLFDVNAQRPVSMWQAGDCRDIVQSLNIQCIASNQILPGEVCVGFSNGKAATLDIRSGEVTCIGPLHEGPIRSLQYVGDHYVISGGSDRKVRVWDRRKIASKIIAPLYSHSGFRDEISGLYSIGLRYVIATAGPRMKVLDLHLDTNQNQKPSKLRNESNTKESSSISGAAFMGLSGLLVFANEEGGFYICE